MNIDFVRRRNVLTHGSGAIAGLAVLNSPLFAQAFPARTGEEVVPWADPPPENPVPDQVQNQLDSHCRVTSERPGRWGRRASQPTTLL